MAKIKRSVSMILSVLMAASVLTTAPVSAATVEASDAGANVAEAVQAELKIAEGSCGDKLTWVLDNDGVLEISGEGKMYDFDFEAKEGENSFNPWTLYRDQIKKVVVNDGVEYIGNFAFFGFAELEEAQIADSVKEIGENAFEGCEKLDAEAFTEPATEAATEEETTEAVVEETTKNSPIVVKEEEEAVGAAAEEEAVGATAISSCTITLGATTYNYDGNAKKPAVTVTYNSKTLTKGTDYTIAYKNNINAGTATVTVTGKGSYSGSVAKNYTIKKRAISSATIKLSASNYVYNGAARKPGVTATYNSITLVKDTDFSVAYKNNTNVGTATVTITGKGTNFSGTATKTFTIQKKSITKCTVTIDDSACTYAGKSVYPKITVKDGDKVLQIGSDFGPLYTNTIDAGTQVLKLQGIGNYGDIVETSYTIKPKSIAGVTVTPEYTTTQFDITRKRPTAKVMDGTKELVAGTDFTYGYSNNLEAGTATLLIKGTGNYTGTYKTYFTITPKPVSELTYKINSSSVVYDGTNKFLDMSVYHGNKYLVHGVNYYTEYTNNVNVGTATVKVIGCGSYSGTVTKTFKITKKPIGETNITLSATAFTYNGSAQSPTVTVTDGDKTLTNNTDYKYTVTNNISAGTATVTVTGLGNYGSTSTQTFKINAKSLTSSMVKLNQTSFDYDGSAKTAGVTVTDGSKTLVNGTDYTLTYNDNTDAGAATVTVKGKGNYKGSISKTYTIYAKQMYTTSSTLSTYTNYYTGSEVRPTVTVKDGAKVLVEGTDYTLRYINNINAGVASYELTGKGNYRGTVSNSFRIYYPLAKATVKLTSNTVTYNGTYIRPGVTVKYGSKTLTEDVDFYTTQQNNLNVGTANIAIMGKGDYEGRINVPFTIAPKSISACAVTVDCPDNEYDGKTKNYTVIVKDGEKTLENGKDYDLKRSGPPVGHGVGKWDITVTGKGNYTGTVMSFVEIKPRSINKTIGFVSRQNYFLDESNKVRQVISIKDDLSGNLTEIDTSKYKLTYVDNSNGTVDAIVEGLDTYSGTKTIHYRPEIPDNAFVWGRDNWSFDNTSINYPYKYTVNDQVMGIMTNELCLSESDYNNLQNNIVGDNYYGWGGSCYGMSVSLILAKEGYLSPTVYYGDAVTSNYKPVKGTEQDNVISAINFIQELQGNCSFTSLKSDAINHRSDYTNKQYFEKVEEFFDNNNDNNSLIQLSYSGTWGAHAVVAYGYEGYYYHSDQTNLTYNKRLLIYDPNYGSKNIVYKESCIYYNDDGNWLCPYWNTTQDNGQIRNMILHTSVTDTHDIMSGKSWIYNHNKGYYEMNNKGYLTAINDGYSVEKDYVNDTYNLCINCYTAENEALFGDIDLDGEVNVNDVTLLSNYLAELAALDDAQLYAADVDHDGNVSIADVMYLQFYLAEFV